MKAASRVTWKSTTLLSVVGLLVGAAVHLLAFSPAKADSSGTPADLNCDGVVDLADVEPFTLALLSPHAWCARYGRDVEYLLSIADFDRDGALTVHDVDSFCAALGLDRGEGPSENASEMPPASRIPCQVDLDIDSDNDSGFANPERDQAEDDLEPSHADPNDPNVPAKYLLFNDDDDDQDGIADCNDPVVIGEDDLVPMALEARAECGSAVPCQTKLKHCFFYDNERLRVWAKPRWTGEADLVVSDPNCSQTGIYCSGSEREHLVWLQGDMNADGAISNADVNPFVTALTDYDAWLTKYILHDPNDPNWPNHWFPDMAERAIYIGDMNYDGVLDFKDVNPFIANLPIQPRSYVPVWFWVEGIRATRDGVGEAAQPRLIVAHSQIGPSSSCMMDIVKVECHRCNGDGFPMVPKGYGERCVLATEGIGCWERSVQDANDCRFGEPQGYPPCMSVMAGVGPADLPPRKLDPTLSSAPLVAGGAVHSRLNPHAERAMHEDVLDLVTGVPLLQEIDFSLPFGSAVFRHVRTYSELFMHQFFAADCGHLCDIGCDSYVNHIPYAAAHMWDWNGQFWMMSESPLLMIDAAYRDTVDWVSNPEVPGDPGFGQRICYFIPDAHHAIPFVDWYGEGEYAAPSWFDATLAHNGDKQHGDWVTRPTWFEVRTQRGAVVYTFEPHYEDLWPAEAGAGVDPHAHPKDPINADPTHMQGLPWYGLLVGIRDNVGNRVEYVYAPTCSYACPEQNFGQNSDRCEPCCVNCNAKGQVQAIKLRAAPAAGEAEGRIIWTLLYTYRTFNSMYYDPSDPQWQQTKTLDALLHTALYSIHVYEGDVSVPEQPRVLRYHEYFDGLTSFDDYEAVEQRLYSDDGQGSANQLPTDWVLRAQYIHEEYNDTVGTHYRSAYAVAPEGTQYRAFHDVLGEDGRYHGGYRLLKTAVTRRDDETASDTAESTLYRYRGLKLDWNPSGVFSQFAGMWGNKTCGAIQKYRAGRSVNDLIGMASDAPLVIGDPSDPEDPNTAPTTTLEALSELGFSRNGSYPPGFSMAAFENFVSVAVENLTCMGDTVNEMSRVTDDENRRRQWRILRLRAYPGPAENVGEGMSATHGHTPYRFPYRVDGAKFAGGTSGEFVPLSMHAPFHITVIDELDPNQSGVYNPWQMKKIAQRRVVELNPAGFVLSDTTWDLTPDNYGEVIEQKGSCERRFYDAEGRVAMIGSKGWGAADNPDQESQGLVRVLLYEPGSNGKAGELKAVGIREGTGAVTLGEPVDPNVYCDGVFWTQAYAHDPLRPDVVTQEVRYLTPRAEITFDADLTTSYAYTYADAGDPHSAITSKVITRPAVTGRDGNPCSAIEKYVYDPRGNLQWTGAGSESEFFISYTAYNDFGQPVTAVVDMAPGYDGVEYPTGWQRLSATLPLNEVSTWSYHPVWGPVKMTYPNGRETHLIYESNPDDPFALTAWEYRDVVPPVAGVSDCSYLSPIKRTEMAAGNVLSVKEIRWNDAWGTPPYPPSGGVAYSASDVVSESYPAYSPSGQMVGMTQGSGSATLSSSVAYYGGDLVAREEAPDGTITRYTYDSLARLERTFRGTSDTHCAWGSIDCADPCAPAPNAADNMLLIEKRYYGEGITDADELVTIRHYRDEPANQYLMWNPDGHNPNDPNAPDGWWQDNIVPNEDEIGWTTDYGYDWRMRPCCQIEFGPHEPNDPAPTLRQTFTWYDNLDRAVIVAEYASAANPGALDPRLLGPSWPESAAVISAAAESLATTGPLSLTEYCYNARGQTEETRQWRLVEGAPAYTATWTYYDHGDRPVEVHSPNAPTQKHTYDAKGRQVLSETVASDLPDGQSGFTDVLVAATMTVYDANDRALLTTHTEYDGATPIDSFVRNWYDLAGRVVTTANYGTNQGTYSAGGLPPNLDDPNAPATDTPGVLVTSFEYDDAGRQKAVYHPDGTVTSTEYDVLGRVLLTVENVDDASNPPLMQITAYQYGTGGQLVAMAGVATEYFQGASPQWAAIDWDDLNNPLLQITRFEYADAVVRGSVIVDWDTGPWKWRTRVMNGGNWGEWTAESANRALISDVIYPDGKTLSFTYYSDGAVASRTDSRGNALYYTYDALGQLTDAWIDDAPYYYTYPQPPAPWRPTDRVQHIHYTYTADGQLDSATAYNWDQTGAATVIAQSICTYGPWQNLQSEQQQHFDLVTPESPLVWYDWNYGGVTSGNFNRLTDITYPSGTPVHFDYGAAGSVDDALNRVCGLTDGAASYAAFAYVGTGRRVFSSRGNGVIQSFGSGGDYDGLDQFGRVIDLDFVAGGQTVHRYQYGYDTSGNRLYARVTQATINGVDHENDRSQAHAYDPLQRLIQSGVGRLAADNSAIVPDPTAPLKRDLGWQLDDFGNWTGAGAVPGFYRNDDLDGDGNADTTLDVTHTVNAANALTTVTSDPGTTQPIITDLAGNLVWDGEFFCHYDGLNRLVQVNLAEQLQPGDFNADGRLINCTPLGRIVAKYAYDALGRLSRSQRFDHLGGEQVADFYYDGVRRIEEVESTTPATGDPTTAVRDYVYGPEYVDELICQVDYAGSMSVPPVNWYYLQDANYNVVALTEAGGAVVTQFTYEPYGTLVAVDRPVGVTWPRSAAGHQGLFFERLYKSHPVTHQPLKVDAKGLYYMRNRWYSPALGRPLQMDLNESASLVVAAMAMNGQTLANFVSAFAATGHYGDGMNLYLYAGENPVYRLDALGLEWGMEDEIDEQISDLTGHALYGLATLNEGAKWASLGLQTTLSIAWSLLPGSGLYDAFKSVQVIASGKGGFWDAINIATAAFPLAGKALDGVTALRGLLKARGWGWKACNCFVGGTEVDTPEGRVAIESVQPGDEVLTASQDCPGQTPHAGRVRRVFRDVTPVILWLTLTSGEVLGTTPEHEVWTFEHGWDSAGRLEVGDRFLGADGQPEGITEITIDRSQTVVYNLEIEGTYTYFVHSVWVHNNSCTIAAEFVEHGHHLVPRFLGGWDKLGKRIGLPDFMHQEFHAMLRENLRLADIALPENAGREAWEALMRDPQMFDTVRETLINTTAQFDRSRGTQVLSRLVDELRRQGWM